MLAKRKLIKRKGAPVLVPFFMDIIQWPCFNPVALIIVFTCLVLPIGVNTSASAGSSRSLSGHELPACLSRLQAEPVNVARVTDGDTLVLTDKRRVRLIGINTLELNEKNPEDRLWADTATNALELFVQAGSIRIISGKETHDRHGRLLAHVTNQDGRNAGHELVNQGLAIAIAVGKNTRCADELHSLEQNARQAAAGLWYKPGNWQFVQPHLTGLERGFRIVHGQVVHTKGRGKRLTLILDNGLIVRLGNYWPHTDKTAQIILNSIVGKQIRVRGWLGGSTGKIHVTINHPTNLDVAQR